ncbi:DNA-formamidopyrimidine glycosylase family protein [Euzebya tangerina]|uniref:DNA-formamidopyrimidine glycosylase family protein n=1 Tax=Euzebya tangerina TaxID=591198 RepID=UPI0013C2F652|nr:DNA-formamidopyrimidine glycosylase family protein [Euzebya tangerina]
MPELPEVRAHAERMTAALAGDTLSKVQLISFSTLKTFDPPIDGAVGTGLDHVRTRGKLMILDFGTTAHVVHLMQGGRLKPDPKVAKKPRGGMVRWSFERDGAWLLTEAGTERKAGVWAVRGTPEEQEPLDHLGPEADEVDVPTMTRLLGEHSARLHTFLRDQRIMAGVGRMLANEICHRAKLSPFAQTASMGEEEAAVIVEATGAAIDDALAAERARDDMSSSKERPSRVHNRTGEPCPVCGDEVRSVEYRAYTVCYCATCQTGGKVLADNTTSKFLK